MATPSIRFMIDQFILINVVASDLPTARTAAVLAATRPGSPREPASPQLRRGGTALLRLRPMPAAPGPKSRAHGPGRAVRRAYGRSRWPDGPERQPPRGARRAGADPPCAPAARR